MLTAAEIASTYTLNEENISHVTTIIEVISI